MSTTTLSVTPVARRRTWLNAKLLVVVAVLVATVGFLVYNAMGSSMAYFVTVTEMQSSTKDLTGSAMRVGGNVQQGSIQRDGFGGTLNFTMTDGTHTVPVTYAGEVPDIFADNVEVVVEGTLQPDGSIQASNLLTKCPSKFEAADAPGS